MDGAVSARSQKLKQELFMSFKELQQRLAAAKDESGELAKSAAAAGADGGAEAGAGDNDDDDEANAAAAAAGGAADAGGDGGADGADAGGDANDEVLGKSFKLTLEDGTEIEYQDGAELVKSMLERMENTDEVMAKAVGGVLDVVGDLKVVIQTQATTIAEQGKLLKSLQGQIGSLGNKGAGRVSTISVLSKSSPGAGSAARPVQQPSMTRDEVLAKASSLHREGKLNGLQVATVEADLNAGRKPAAEVLALINA
jgi:hypothetical protein